MVGQSYPTGLQLNKANSSDTEAPFLDLIFSITDGIGSSKIVSAYGQEIPQSQTAHNPMAQRGRDTQPQRDTRKTN